MYQLQKDLTTGEYAMTEVRIDAQHAEMLKATGAKFFDEKSKEVNDFLAARKQADAKREADTKELTDWLKETKAPKAIYERLGIVYPESAKETNAQPTKAGS